MPGSASGSVLVKNAAEGKLRVAAEVVPWNQPTPDIHEKATNLGYLQSNIIPTSISGGRT